MTDTITEVLTVKVGDFFVASWGYEQSNIDFYKVVGVTAKSVKVQKWSSAVVADHGPQVSVVPGEGPSTWTDWSAVDQNADHWTQQEQKVTRDAPILTKRLQSGYRGEPSIRIESYAYGRLWHGEACSETGYGWGH